MSDSSGNESDENKQGQQKAATGNEHHHVAVEMGAFLVRHFGAKML